MFCLLEEVPNTVMAAVSNTEVRGTRLTTLVSNADGQMIARQAEAAGLSISAYLRDRALGIEPDAAEQAALRQVDTLIDRIESNLDSAVAELSAVMARMAAT